MHQRVRQGYLYSLEKDPERLVKIDASQALEDVVKDSLAVLNQHLNSKS